MPADYTAERQATCPTCGHGITNTLSLPIRESVVATRWRWLEEELLRVRTTAHGAAHQLDNIAVEQGWGAGLPPLEIANRIRARLRETAP